jgi:hypothetical protein
VFSRSAIQSFVALVTVVSNLQTGEPLWFGQDRKQERNSRDGETLDAFGLVNDLLVGTLSPEDWVQKCLHKKLSVSLQTIPTAPSA